MFKTIDEYLDALRTAMRGCDAALAQDAQSDAREHLTVALAAARESAPNVGEAEALAKIVEEYGTPEETASTYREVERRTSPVFKPAVKSASAWGRFFAVYNDPKAWGSLLYMLIAMLTGILYFTWAVTGLSLSVSLAIFIFGLLFAAFFIVSLRGLALLEGRLVEGLLGVRMPRRPLFVRAEGTWLANLKANLVDAQTWRTFVYMLLQMPLGVVYFTVTVALFAFSMSFMAAPILQWIVKMPIVSVGEARYFLPFWATPLAMLVGFLLWTATLHLGRALGGLHGRYAKWMLVAE